MIKLCCIVIVVALGYFLIRKYFKHSEQKSTSSKKDTMADDIMNTFRRNKK
jgi:uncharacterized protein YneF (UPF0154 family)